MIDVVKLHQFRPFLGRHDGKPATNIPYIFPVQKFKNSSRSLFHLSSIKKKEVIEKKKLLAPRFIFKYRKGISPREKVSLSCRGNRRIIRGKTEKKSRVPWQLFPPPTPFFLFFLSPPLFSLFIFKQSSIELFIQRCYPTHQSLQRGKVDKIKRVL